MFTKQKKEIIYWGEILNQKGFVTARSGNISYKIGKDKILITSHDCYLGHLDEKDVLLVDPKGGVVEGEGTLTTERDLHLAIHSQCKDIQVVVHAHAPFTTAFFHYFRELDIFSFEAKFYLGEIKVIPQETPTVTDVEPVVKALASCNIVVLGGHGVVSVGRDFKEAMSLLELLEEQAKVNLFIRRSNISSQPLASSRGKESSHEACTKKYQLLSDKHIESLVELVNNDTEVQELGKKYALTCTLAVKNQDTHDVMCFHYQDGKIIKWDRTDSAEFVITGKTDILKKVFNREIEPFVASTQGKVKTKGDFAKMSKWYPVLVKTFKLWEKAPVE